MKFDLFDALKKMESQFGDDVDIRVSNANHAISITLSVWAVDDWHHTRFETTKIELRDANVNLMNRKFERGLAELQHYMDNM